VKVDPVIPGKIVKEVFEEQPVPAKWSEDLAILMDPNIRARSFALPAAGAVTIKNKDYRYKWIRYSLGPNPDTSRYLQCKTVLHGQNATTDDVEVLNADIVEGKTEIRSGDRILMKFPRDIYDGGMKQSMLDSIHQTRRAARGEYQDPSGRVMRTSDYGGTSSADMITGERSGEFDPAAMMQRSSPQNTSIAGQKGGK
jgi:hypothetical protein